MLGYCYYYTQEYALAAECYGQLTKQCPTHSEYALYYAQSLYNACSFDEAISAVSQVRDPALNVWMFYWSRDIER